MGIRKVTPTKTSQVVHVGWKHKMPRDANFKLQNAAKGGGKREFAVDWTRDYDLEEITALLADLYTNSTNEDDFQHSTIHLGNYHGVKYTEFRDRRNVLCKFKKFAEVIKDSQHRIIVYLLTEYDPTLTVQSDVSSSKYSVDRSSKDDFYYREQYSRSTDYQRKSIHNSKEQKNGVSRPQFPQIPRSSEVYSGRIPFVSSTDVNDSPRLRTPDDHHIFDKMDLPMGNNHEQLIKSSGDTEFNGSNQSARHLKHAVNSPTNEQKSEGHFKKPNSSYIPSRTKRIESERSDRNFRENHKEPSFETKRDIFKLPTFLRSTENKTQMTNRDILNDKNSTVREREGNMKFSQPSDKKTNSSVASPSFSALTGYLITRDETGNIDDMSHQKMDKSRSKSRAPDGRHSPTSKQENQENRGPLKMNDSSKIQVSTNFQNPSIKSNKRKSDSEIESGILTGHKRQTSNVDNKRHSAPEKFLISPQDIIDLQITKLQLCSLTIEIILDKNRLVFENEIGRGGQGYVRVGRFDGKRVAIKSVRTITEKLERDLLREVCLLDKMRHRNIVEIFAICPSDPREYHVVMELVPGDSLAKIIFDPQVKKLYNLYDSHYIDICYQLSGIIRFLHKHGVLHRDIKPSNIMIFQIDHISVNVKLLDFGLGKIEVFDSPLLNTENSGYFKGTRPYMAPEIMVHHKPATFASDIWSLGCSIIEMLTKKHIWKITTEQALRDVLTKQIQPGPLTKNHLDSEKLRNLIMSCVSYNPADRPKAHDLYKVFCQARYGHDSVIEEADDILFG